MYCAHFSDTEWIQSFILVCKTNKICVKHIDATEENVFGQCAHTHTKMNACTSAHAACVRVWLEGGSGGAHNRQSFQWSD